MRIWFLLILLGMCTQALHAAEKISPEQIEFFEKQVRPVFANHCYECHSAKQQKGGLRLDSRAAMLRGGDSGPAIVEGKPGESLLIEAIQYDPFSYQMPPKGKLKDSQIAAITKWVKFGAPWPNSKDLPAVAAQEEEFPLQERMKHWSFQPLQSPTPPQLKNDGWSSSPVDCFLLQKLREQNLTPAEPADKHTLLRRVTYDLTGLPPTPEEIEEFLKDTSPDALEKVVDRLLDSPQYGERWARHWLDLVRFAETRGHEFDFNIPHAYQYRDYVIRALNDDLPYDQFVKEHIAGDLLANPRRHPSEDWNESILGTGFFFLGEGKHSPVDIREEEATQIDNQIDVFSKAFLGLTVSCARCHDHKFDPIRAKDYYALAGYLQSSRYDIAFIDHPKKYQPHLEQLAAIEHQFEEITAGQLRQSPNAKQLQRELEAVVGLVREDAAPDEALNARRLERWKKLLIAAKEQGKQPLYPLAALLLGSHDSTQISRRLTTLIAQSAQKAQEIAQRGDEIFTTFTQAEYQQWTPSGYAFEHLQAGEPLFASPTKLTMAGSSQAHSGKLARSTQGILRSPTFEITKDFIHYRVRGEKTQVRLIIDGFQLIRNPIYGGLEFPIKKPEEYYWHVQDVHMWKGHRAYIEVLDESDGWVALDEIRFSDHRHPRPDAPNAAVLELLQVCQENQDTIFAHVAAFLAELGEEKVSPAQAELKKILVDEGLLLDQSQLVQQCESLDQQRQKIDARLPNPKRALAITDGTPENEFLHIRGNHKQLGEEVPRRFLEALGGLEQQPASNASGRLQLAEKLLNPQENPLFVRVMVNRVWMHHFGKGIVPTPDDFGHMGQPPTHPELLDWLAQEFVRNDYSLKHLHKVMLLSSAYQMSSQADPHAAEMDPLNKTLHHMPVQRLEAEAIRDGILAVAGELNLTMYGPSVLPHLTPFMQGRGRPRSGPLDGNGRRSLYINVRRNFLTPMFLAFDYPQPFTTIGKRGSSNVPAQALTLLNSPFVAQQAERWAKRITDMPLSTNEKIEHMYLRAFGRPASTNERGQAAAFIQQQTESQGERNAWRDLAHILFNLKEFVYIY